MISEKSMDLFIMWMIKKALSEVISGDTNKLVLGTDGKLYV